jgi:hypothetical protein
VNSRGRVYATGGPIIAVLVALFTVYWLFLKYTAIVVWYLMVGICRACVWSYRQTTLLVERRRASRAAEREVTDVRS